MITVKPKSATKKRRPKLPLSKRERQVLKRTRLSLAELSQMSPESLVKATNGGISRRRSKRLVGSAKLQQLASIGPACADDLLLLGIDCVEKLVGQHPTRLFEQLNQRTGVRHDPCVEDVFRCAIAQAEQPDLPEALGQWWMWTPLRGKPATARSSSPRST